MQAPPGKVKENSKSIKVKEKVILVGDSIVSGVNGKGLSTDKFTTVVCDIPATIFLQHQMIWSITQFHLQRKKPKKQLPTQAPMIFIEI